MLPVAQPRERTNLQTEDELWTPLFNPIADPKECMVFHLSFVGPVDSPRGTAGFTRGCT
jgi:hypothetical protein